jgi:hypothetical protein
LSLPDEWLQKYPALWFAKLCLVTYL